MTRDQAKTLMPVIQAWAEGKTVQQRYHRITEDKWIDAALCNLDNEAIEWRIKPEPREWWISIKSGTAYQHKPTDSPLLPTIHVREVL